MTAWICLTADRKPGPAVGSVTDALDISGYFNRLLHEHAGEAEFLQLRRMAEEVGIPLCSVGGIISFSIYPLTAREPEVVQTSMDAVRRMLDAAQVLGAASALVIPGVATEDMAYEEAYTTAQERVSELADYAPSVGLMIENVWNNMLYSPLELARFVDEMGRKNVGICFDIANARRFGYPGRTDFGVPLQGLPHVGGQHQRFYQPAGRGCKLSGGDGGYPGHRL